MKRLEVKAHELGELKALVPLKEGEGYDQVVEETTDVYEGGRPVILFNNELGTKAIRLLQVLQRIRYHREHRSAGLETNARTFGYLPRLTIRRDFCTASMLMTEDPRAGQVLTEWSGIAATMWAQRDPEGHAKQRGLLAAKVREEWRMPGGVFTSGICNMNNPLRLHHDKGNFAGSWSAMFAFTHNVKGGLLVLPGYRVAFRFHRPSFIIFDGQRNLHGVSPIKYIGRGGYRYSVVYYAMQAMGKCLSAQEELERIRVVKTQREAKRVGGT